MGALNAADGPHATRHAWSWIGIVLLVLGLLGHVFAAKAIGGTHLAYRDHLLGFVVITVIAGAIIFGVGSRFWKGRYDISLLLLGAVNALVGLLVYIQRFHVHG
ncbi:MAG TPA: hypothetical protein VGJ12_13995 [Gemmatimonadaceae bacterium]